MLVKRTNILFDEALWSLLVMRASHEQTSVGELVRRAVRDTYSADQKQAQIQTAVATITRLRKKHSRIDYGALINYGRKY